MTMGIYQMRGKEITTKIMEDKKIKEYLKYGKVRYKLY